MLQTGRSENLARIDSQRLGLLIEREAARFEETHPKSKQMAAEAAETLLTGAPIPWMISPYTSFPVFAEGGKDARVHDVDGHEYIDFFLSISAATFGHSPDPIIQAIAEQVPKGLTLMMPTEDSIRLGRALQQRFGLPFWHMALTATDAIRFAIRLSRAVSGRRKVLLFNGCFHGALDETMMRLVDGSVTSSLGIVGAIEDPFQTTAMVEMNDLPALEKALAPGDIACVVAEPALTNVGMVLPDPGFHERLRELTRDTGTSLVIDETHTICTGPRGYTGAFGLEPDMLVLGKCVAGGIPMAILGCSDAVKLAASAKLERDEDIGIAGTLTGNALSIRAAYATIQHLMTDEVYDHMITLCKRLEGGIRGVIDAFGLPWHVTRLGFRTEFHFRREPLHNGSEGRAIADPELEHYIHLFFLNRGMRVTDFHNTRITSPAMTEADIDQHTAVFDACISELVATG